MRDRLLPYALGAFHAFLLLYLVVVLAIRADGNVLAGIGTWTGIAIGAWLAVLSWAATGWALRGQTLSRGHVQPIVARAGIAGFAAGAAFVPGVLLIVGAFERAALLVALVASPFAGAVGSLVAILLALIDVGLYLVVARVLRKA